MSETSSRPDSPLDPRPDPESHRDSSRPTQAGRRGFFPPARVRALSRTAVMVVASAFFLILGFVAMRYSHDQAQDPGATREVPVQGSVLTPEELEWIANRARRLAELAEEQRQGTEVPPVLLPPAPNPPPPPPRISRAGGESIFAVPMTPRGSGGSQGLSQLSTGSLLEEGRRLVDSLRSTPAPAADLSSVGSVAYPATSTAVEVNLVEPRGLQLRRGSFLPVVLTHAINTDVPGIIRGHLARDVRDATGRHVLLPQGTIVVGQQRSSLSTGDGRLVIDWHSIQLPDGRTLDLAEPQGTAAMDGSLGATGKIDRHFGARFGTALMLGALGATFQLSQPQSFQDSRATFGQAASERQIVAGEVGARLNDLAERTLEERLNRPPTIEIPAGARLHLVVLNDLVFPPSHPRPRIRPGMKSPGYTSAPAEAGFRSAPTARAGIPGGGAIVSERRAAGPGGASSSLRPEGTRAGPD